MKAAMFVLVALLALTKPGITLGIAVDQAIFFPNHRQLETQLVDASSVKLHVTLKRKANHIHGHSEFDVFANPVVSDDGAKVLYDGYASFVMDKTEFTYAFVNGSDYLETHTNSSDGEVKRRIQCLPSDTLPFHDILPALNDAMPISSASIGDEVIECASGNLFKTSFAGSRFAICVSGESGFKVYSSDLSIDVEYLDKSVNLPLKEEAVSCKSVDFATSVTPTTLVLLTGNAVPESISRQLKAAKHMEMESSTCKCKSTPRQCIFFHGIGSRHETEELQNTPKLASGRMGNMNNHAPCCSTVKYAILNTMDYSWTSDSLQEKFCDRALRFSDVSDVNSGTITDTVIVTHSMAGLVMSMALATGKCSFGEGSSWVAISSPMMGSMASDYFQDYCTDKISDVATELLDIFGQCPMPVARQSLVYENAQYSTKKHTAAYHAAQEAYRGNVSAAMCSNSYHGLISVYRPIMIAAAKLVPHKSPENDGLVEYQSCENGIEDAGFGNNYKGKFYAPELNHADTVFLNGDGFFKDSQKPVKWFECAINASTSV